METQLQQTENRDYEFIDKIPKPLLWGIYVLLCLVFGYLIGKIFVV